MPNVIYVICGADDRHRRFISSLKTDADPLWISLEISDTSAKGIKIAREKFFLPILEGAGKIPVVAFGELGAKLVAGGNPTETSMINKTFVMHDRVCAFTYHPKIYFDGQKGEGEKLDPREEEVATNIYTTIVSTLRPVIAPTKIVGKLPFGKSLTNIVIDLETTDVEYPFCGSSKPTLIGVMPLGKPPYIVQPRDVSEQTKRSLAENVQLVIGHNVLFDLVHLHHMGIDFPKARIHDTLIYHKNAFPNEWFYGLKPLAKKYGTFPQWDAWFASNHHKIDYANLSDENLDKVSDYNAIDLFATEFLYERQKKTYHPFDLEMDYLRYVLRMVINGFHVDREGIDSLLTKTECELGDAVYALKKEFNLGKDFNFNSPPQVLSLLRRSIPNIKATGAPELAKYEKDFPFIQKLLKVRDLEKLGGTGLEGLKEYIDPNDLVHSSYAVHGAETGRSSSSTPNLQNTDPRVRPFFVSRYNNGRLIHTDLAGIEYRLIAHASQDKELLRIFNAGEDIHDNAYFKIYGEWPPNKLRRKLGKTANFLGVYGGGYKKFLFAAGLDDNDGSRQAFKVVSGMYPGVEKWKRSIERRLYDYGRVHSLFGRVRDFERVDQDAVREAINWIIQSSGHDILKIYSMEMCDRLRMGDFHSTLLVSEVHDSNTFDSPQGEWGEAVEVIEDLAKDLNPLILKYLGEKMRLPIVAEVEVMTHWA